MLGKRHNKLDRQADYWLHCTSLCNWNCDYCLVDTHNAEKVSFEKLINTIDLKILDNSFVSLTGGEIGTMNKYNVDILFKKLNEKKCDICIDTNGLFIRKFPEYYTKIVDYFYHCSETLGDEDILENISDLDNKITFMIVVSDSNFKNAKKFLTKWDNVLFHVHGAMSNNNRGNTLSKINALKLFHMCSKMKNVNQEHLSYILHSYDSKNYHNFIDSRI